MRIDFHRINQPAEALFAPGADVLSLSLAVSLIQKRSDRATVRTWVDGEPLQYTIRGDSYDISADYGNGPETLASQKKPHFHRVLTGRDTHLDIRPGEEREEITGHVGTVPVRIEAGDTVEGELGGERLHVSFHEGADGMFQVEGALGALRLHEDVVTTENGYLVTGQLGQHSIRQEVTRV